MGSEKVWVYRQQEAFEKELEKFSIRRVPLGTDRHHRRYWWGLAGQRAAIYIEKPEGEWTVLSSASELDALMTALEKRGIRELALHAALEKVSSDDLVETNSPQSCIRDIGYSMLFRPFDTASPPSLQLLPVWTSQSRVEILFSAEQCLHMCLGRAFFQPGL